ncbi:MAG TPA: TonB-dependent receptor [Caulobacteraceae bacterium]
MRTLLCSAAGLSALAIAGFAHAQASGGAAPAATNPQAGEVIVTARQRSESLEKAPVQVTAFTAQTIRDKGIEMPRDFIQATPNVTLVETQNIGTSFVVIRGISQARNSEPSVAVVVDGVPETQPAQFNQELFDIDQIEVLKGPQGALYGRNAIGGAILITTKEPGGTWQGRMTAGYDSGPGGKAQGVISGPLSDTLGMVAGLSYTDTSGYIENTYLHEKADPATDLNGRLKFRWRPTDKFTADLRLSADRLWTQGFDYNIVYYPGLNFNVGPPYPDYTQFQVPDVNNASLPVRVNNPGKNNRAIYDASLKMDYQADFGTLSSISGYDLTKEIITGDSFDFLPANESLLHLFYGYDQNQSQFLRVRTLTQEFRVTSPAAQPFRWIAGAEIYGTQRYIANGNEWDTGQGVAPTFYAPTTPIAYPFGPGAPTDPHDQESYLADSQDNFAWAAYLDTSTDLTRQLELSLNVRFDSDHRRNTTVTPQAFLDEFLIPAHTGDVREHTFTGWQPQAILKYTPTDNLTFYGSYGKGFRSGGFNQTGVATAAAAAGFVGVGDVFKAEHDETWEAGFKSRWFDNRVTFNGSVYTNLSKNGYFFVYLASNGTQNLGNIPAVRYKGVDLDGSLRLTDDLSLTAGFGYTDSKVTQYYHALAPQYDFRIGEQAPLVSKYTFDLGVEYRPKLSNTLTGLVRLDYNRIGRTYFWESDPNVTTNGAPPVISRNPVDLLDARVGVETADWTLVFWAKNLNNANYNAEYSPGGFVFKALPRRWGIDLTRRF